MNRNEMISSLVRFLADYRLYRPDNESQLMALVRHLSMSVEVTSPESALQKIRGLRLIPDVQITDQAIIDRWRDSLVNSTQSVTKAQSSSDIVAPHSMGVDAALASKAIGSHRKVMKKIGEGGMGIVLLVMNQLLHRREVVKLMKGGDQEDMARFRLEAQAMAQVNHPNVVQILEVGTTVQDPFLVLEFVEGETLKAHLRQVGAMEFSSALKLIRPAIAGIHSLHKRGIIHRDIKPENLMIRQENGELVVLDLGLAKQSGAREASVNLSSLTMSQYGVAKTQTGQLLGTPKYMAPEQATSLPITPATDIWAIGCILFQMLSGECLNTGKTMLDTLRIVLEEDLATRAEERLAELGVPGFVRGLIAQCVQRDAGARPQSCEELLAIIDDYFVTLEEDRIASAERGIAAQQLLSAKQKRIRQLLWAGVGMALLSIGLVLFFAKAKSEAEKRESAEAKARQEAVTREEAQAQAAQEAEERVKIAEKARQASAQVESANQHVANGRWEEAKTLLEGVVEDFPDQQNARRLLLEVYDVLGNPKRIEQSRWLARNSNGEARQNYLLRAVMGVDTMDDTTVEAVNSQLKLADEIMKDMEGLHLNLAQIMRELYAANRSLHQGRRREWHETRMRALRKAGDYANVSHESWETRFVLGLFQVLSAQLAWAMEPNVQAPDLNRLDIYMRGWTRSFTTMNEAARANPDYHLTLYFRQLCRRELARLIRLDTRITNERRALLAVAELAPAFQDLERLQVLRPDSPMETYSVADCALELARPEVFNRKKRLWYLKRAMQLLAQCEERVAEEKYAPMAELVYLSSAKAHALDWVLNESEDAKARARGYLDRARLVKKDGEYDAIYLTVTEMIE